MAWIKVCGITNVEDARLAAEAGADALGFVFAESPRQVNVATVRMITSHQERTIDRVGVFVDATVEQVVNTAIEAGLTAVQLHGAETVDFARKLHEELSRLSTPVKIIRTISLPAAEGGKEEMLGWDPASVGIVEVDPHSAHMKPGVFAAVLVDSGSAMQRGGTGKTFDWHATRMLVAFMQSYTRLIVAGGLNPDNVSEAIELFHPWGVDVSTGVEMSPGKKNPEKVNAFISAVRATERRL
ncbi:MAG TPA: phosphoribosylanthranilate isomerase [Terriglobales bacterium]|nr:phosphoribosylanthranilate isomerase [Terriglobales bacterium]